MKFPCQTLSLAAALLSAPAVFAQATMPDGAVALNQEAALAGGITGAMDSPGFPITISKSGSYRLTGNLTVPAGQDGIVIVDGTDVVIDLNGFSITGAANCSAATSCFALDGTAGVRAPSSGISHVTVFNGRIRGFSWAGVGGPNGANSMTTYGNATLENVRLVGNGQGLRLGRALISRVRVEANSSVGMYINMGSVSQSHAYANGSAGMVVVRGSIRDSLALNNGGTGFAVGDKTLLHGNAADLNGSGSIAGGMPVAGGNAF